MSVRGCGTRCLGGIYLETGLNPFGSPIEDFLLDPPLLADAKKMGLSPRGVKLIERNGFWHVFDIIGEEYYPNVTDWVEEVRRLGISRRLQSNLEFSKLTPESRLIVLHSRAWDNHHDQFPEECWSCPKDQDGHNTKKRPMCIGLWWESVEIVQKRQPPKGGTTLQDRKILRNMPSFTYEAKSRPPGIPESYSLAIFGSFPIGRLAVVRDPKEGKHERNEAKASESSLTVELVDE